MKKRWISLIWVIFCIVLIIFSFLFMHFYKTPITVPLGSMFFCLALICGIFQFCYFYLYNYVKKKTKTKIKIFPIFLLAIFIFVQILGFVVSSIDLVKGPSEIIISKPELITYSHRNGLHYLKGTTLNNENKKIRISGRQKDKFIDLSKEDRLFKVYYFEKMNLVYDIEIVDMANISNNYIE